MITCEAAHNFWQDRKPLCAIRDMTSGFSDHFGPHSSADEFSLFLALIIILPLILLLFLLKILLKSPNLLLSYSYNNNNYYYGRKNNQNFEKQQ